jgi:hypothetical protein
MEGLKRDNPHVYQNAHIMIQLNLQELKYEKSEHVREVLVKITRSGQRLFHKAK